MTIGGWKEKLWIFEQPLHAIELKSHPIRFLSQKVPHQHENPHIKLSGGNQTGSKNNAIFEEQTPKKSWHCQRLEI